MKIFRWSLSWKKVKKHEKLERRFMKGTSFKAVLIRLREWEVYSEVLMKLSSLSLTL